MKEITLYRPVGLKELQLIVESNFNAFPPRLEWQPIFYPVMNEEYAIEIAMKWNTIDAFSGYCGFVTAFEIDFEFIQKYKVQNVGSKTHNELWVPADELEKFNANIRGRIYVTKTFLGEQFSYTKDNKINQIIRKTS
ncbi:ADP-ribosylation/crystallin J1 [Spongiimicrobium salis]|uniref:ADP-ribosylation/crystallin J1 n=1 Tax=Spongiimicrobium salis TaxID=1667022 RepID=UPI00374DC006